MYACNVYVHAHTNMPMHVCPHTYMHMFVTYLCMYITLTKICYMKRNILKDGIILTEFHNLILIEICHTNGIILHEENSFMVIEI